MFAHSSVNWIHYNTLIHFFGDYKVHLNHKCICWLRSPLQFKLQSATKWVETLCPNLGFFYVSLTSKGDNIAFPSPSPPSNVVPLFKLPIENNKHPTFEWRGQGRGVDCSLRLPYLSTMSQQFCRRLSESQKWPYILEKINSTHFFKLGWGFLFAMFDIIMPIWEQLSEYGGDSITFTAWHFVLRLTCLAIVRHARFFILSFIEPNNKVKRTENFFRFLGNKAVIITKIAV